MKKAQSLITERARRIEARALRVAAGAGAVSALIALAWYLGRGIDVVPIAGATSIARVVIYLAVSINFVLFCIVYRRGVQWRHEHLKTPLPKRWVLWRDTLTLSFAHTVLMLALLALAAYLFTNAFIGLEFDLYTSSIIVGVVVGVSTYMLVPQASDVSINQIVAVLGTILVGGVFVAMLTSGQPNWWQENFSYLGTSASEAARTFNLTLIVSGLVLLSLTETIVNTLAPALSKHQTEIKIRVIKAAFIFVSFALAGVGLFPWTADSILATLHNLSATLLVVGFLFMIAALKWTSPELSTEFFVVSYVLAAVLVLCYVLFNIVGYLNLTAFELLSFGISFAWLMMYLRNLSLLAGEEA